ncbi:MAG: hypothetical protein ACUVSX_11470 [Aggregatilineales bacterium]
MSGFACVALLCALLAACAPAAPTVAEPTAPSAPEQTAPPATATHDTGQFPPLTANPLPGAQAAQPAQIDTAQRTATAIVAAATAQARGAAAQAAVSPAAGCAPSPSVFSASLDRLATQARSALENAGLEPSAVTVTSAGIAAAGEDCAALQPLYTTLAVALPAEATDGAALAGVVERALAALETALAPASLPGAHPPLLALALSADGQPPLTLAVPYGAALEAYAVGLRGPDLLAALGAGGSP